MKERAIKRILRSRLPDRLAHRVPRFLVELMVGLVMAAMLVSLRSALQPIVGDHAPFTFVTLGIVLAALLAGWRSGLIALITGQALTWYMVIKPRWTFALDDPERGWALFISSLSQLVILLVIALYQREVAKGSAERERRMELLGHALREIDHRTMNNYATVLALVHLQAQRSADEGVKQALIQVADRIQAISQATERLALRSGDLESIRLDDHLCGLCEQIERGLSRQNVNVRCEVEEITTSADLAIPIAIIVNELVTNALKHAFDGRDEGNVLVTGRMNGEIRLTVTDNGVGIRGNRKVDRGGLGTKLIENFARQLGARHEITSTEQGTTHDLVIPKAA